jgi:hypothetical protein
MKMTTNKEYYKFSSVWWQWPAGGTKFLKNAMPTFA